MKRIKNNLMHIQTSVDYILIDGLNKKFDFNRLKESSEYPLQNPLIAYEKTQLEEKKKAIKIKNLEKARAAKIERQQQLTKGKYSIFNKASNEVQGLEINHIENVRVAEKRNRFIKGRILFSKKHLEKKTDKPGLNNIENNELTVLEKIKFSLLFIVLTFVIMFLLSKCD